jgi:nucleotide-binding universal stress UspA family protein
MTTQFAPREILFATDFSDAVRPAGMVAADVARQYDARLHVVHVVPMGGDPDASSSALRRIAGELGPGVRTIERVLPGLPARQIVAYASAASIDLIILGTHGRTGVSYALLGSVAEAVARRAPCPVLTVPCERATEHSLADVPAEAPRCVVCAMPSSDLICEPCRALIRGQAIQRKRAEEHAGRASGA